jgi:hypothetical protein
MKENMSFQPSSGFLPLQSTTNGEVTGAARYGSVGGGREREWKVKWVLGDDYSGRLSGHKHLINPPSLFHITPSSSIYQLHSLTTTIS